MLETTRSFGTRPDNDAAAVAFEKRVVKAHVDESIVIAGVRNRIDPDKWRPLMMSFCPFYGLGERLRDSTLPEIPETAFRPVAHMSV